MNRLDLRLVELHLAPSRSKAQELIAAGSVEVETAEGWHVIEQASYQTNLPVRIQANSDILKYVSRGGLKLEQALNHIQLSVKGWRCLDVGLSTGGFTDCLLQAGATSVVGIDVGHGQLAEKIKNDSRVHAFEGVNIRSITQFPEVLSALKPFPQLMVVDLSFISLVTVVPALKELLSESLSGKARPVDSASEQEIAILALVKPQFEVGAENLDKRGVVRDSALFDSVRDLVLRTFEKYGFQIRDYFASDLKGQDGNQEFFVYAAHTE